MIPQFPKSYWKEHVQLPSFPKVQENLHTEVIIVGGGITGLTAAYILCKQDINVVLIDAGYILNGTTGHTTAKITAQHGLIYDDLLQHFGKEQAKHYYDASMEAKRFIEDLIERYKISCDYEKQDAYLYTDNKNNYKELENEYKAYEQLGIDGELLEEMPLDLPHLSALQMKNQAKFHPLKYLQSLLEQSIDMGLKIYEQTTAVGLEYNQSPTVITRDGLRIHANYVIQASQYPFYDGEGFYPTRMYPERAYIIAFKSPLQDPGGIYLNIEKNTRSIRTLSVGEEKLWLVAGENHKTGQGKSTIEHYKTLSTFAKKHFVAEDILYRWSAQDFTTLDKIPYIGPVTKKQKNVYVATGFRKWGMTHGTIAAILITDLIVKGKSDYESLFTPSRFHAGASVKTFMKENIDVAKHLIKGKLEFSKKPIQQLKNDEATIVRINGQRTGVYKDLKGNIFAVDTTCKHMGCEVHWNSGDRSWDCPCHGSRYDYSGKVINGPAKEPLDQINLEL